MDLPPSFIDFDATTNQLDLGEVVSARLELLRRSTSRTIECELANDGSVRADPALLCVVAPRTVSRASASAWRSLPKSCSGTAERSSSLTGPA